MVFHIWGSPFRVCPRKDGETPLESDAVKGGRHPGPVMHPVRKQVGEALLLREVKALELCNSRPLFPDVWPLRDISQHEGPRDEADGDGAGPRGAHDRVAGLGQGAQPAAAAHARGRAQGRRRLLRPQRRREGGTVPRRWLCPFWFWHVGWIGWGCPGAESLRDQNAGA